MIYITEIMHAQAMYEEMKRVKAYFPFRVVSGVLLPDGTFEVFANATAAKANNYARKHGGQVYRFDR